MLMFFWHSEGCSDVYKREGNILFSKCSSYVQLNHGTPGNVEMPSVALIEREATTVVSLLNTLLLYHHMILNTDVFCILEAA